MRVKFSGKVQQCDPAKKQDGTAMLQKDGKTPVYNVYLMCNGGGSAPEVIKFKYWGKEAPKVGTDFEAFGSVDAFLTEQNKARLTARVFAN